MTKEEMKKWIDEADYETLLIKWRFTSIASGDKLFEGEVGDYYAKVMNEKKEKLESGEAVSISKKIGWG